MNVVRKELEVSRVWATNYPHLFLESVRKFHEETRDFLNKKVDTSRDGFVTYVAEK